MTDGPYAEAEEVPAGSPQTDALACACLNITPGEAVFVDDTETRVDGARQAGMPAILFQDNAQVIREIEALIAPGDSHFSGEPGARSSARGSGCGGWET